MKNSSVIRDEKSRKEASAIRIARFALQARAELYPSHFNELMSLACWKFTEAVAKYRTRYATRASLSPNVKRQHEHVVPRLMLRTAMIEHPERADEILKLAIACIVTPDEHRQLDRDAFGWHRYRCIRSDVIDQDTGETADVEALARELDTAWTRLTFAGSSERLQSDVAAPA